MYRDTIVHGVSQVEELLKTDLTSIDHVFFDKEIKNEQLFSLMKFCRKERLSYNLVPEQKLRQIAGTSSHQGVAALCSVRPYFTVERFFSFISEIRSPLVLLPASIEDPGNLGAIIRSAAALGADALLLERKHTAPLNAAAAKSSAGAVEQIPVVRPKNLESVVARCKMEGFSVIGAEIRNGLKPAEVSFSGPVLLVLGGEHRGIPPYLSKLCDRFVSIPMSEKAHSLNVSVTAGVLLYEIVRQRTGANGRSINP